MTNCQSGGGGHMMERHTVQATRREGKRFHVVVCAIWQALMSWFTKKGKCHLLFSSSSLTSWKFDYITFPPPFSALEKSGCRNFVVVSFFSSSSPFIRSRGFVRYVLFVHIFMCVSFIHEDTSPERSKWRVKSNCTGLTTTSRVNSIWYPRQMAHTRVFFGGEENIRRERTCVTGGPSFVLFYRFRLTYFLFFFYLYSSNLSRTHPVLSNRLLLG